MLWVKHPSCGELEFYPYIQWYVDSIAYILVRRRDSIELYLDTMPEDEGVRDTLVSFGVNFASNTSELTLRAVLYKYHHPLFNPL